MLMSFKSWAKSNEHDQFGVRFARELSYCLLLNMAVPCGNSVRRIRRIAEKFNVLSLSYMVANNYKTKGTPLGNKFRSLYDTRIKSEAALHIYAQSDSGSSS